MLLREGGTPEEGCGGFAEHGKTGRSYRCAAHVVRRAAAPVDASKKTGLSLMVQIMLLCERLSGMSYVHTHWVVR